MGKKAATILVFLFISFYSTLGFAQLKKIRVAIPTLDIITLPLKMAQVKGFYQSPDQVFDFSFIEKAIR